MAYKFVRIGVGCRPRRRQSGAARLLLIAAITAAVKFLALPQSFGGILLLIGCLAILVQSVRRAARHQ